MTMIFVAQRAGACTARVSLILALDWACRGHSPCRGASRGTGSDEVCVYTGPDPAGGMLGGPSETGRPPRGSNGCPDAIGGMGEGTTAPPRSRICRLPGAGHETRLPHRLQPPGDPAKVCKA